MSLSMTWMRLIAVLFGIVAAEGCSAGTFSEPVEGTDCRRYQFADGKELTIKEGKIVRLNAVMSGRPRLFEIVVALPSMISDPVSEVSILPAGSVKLNTCGTGSIANKCRLAIGKLPAEAVINSNSALSVEYLRKISDFLERDVLACDGEHVTQNR